MIPPKFSFFYGQNSNLNALLTADSSSGIDICLFRLINKIKKPSPRRLHFLKGYMMKDRLLRPAMVVVSKKPHSEAEVESEGPEDEQKIEVTIEFVNAHCLERFNILWLDDS